MKKRILALAAASMMLLVGCGETQSTEASYSEDNLLSEAEIDKLFSAPDDYVGKSVNLSGRIFNDVQTEDGTVCFQIFTDPVNSEDDVMIYYDDKDYQVKTNEYVLVKGVISDSYTGQNAFGGEVTCPTIKASVVEESNYIDVVSPTLASFDVNTKTSFYGLDMTIEKVEFAKNETRVYTSIVNNSSSIANLYANISSLVQDGKQFEYEYNYDGEYEEIPDTINVGVTVSGILTYPAIDQSDFKLVFCGNVGDDYFEGQEVPVSISESVS